MAPVNLRASINGSALPSAYDLFQTLRDLVDAVNSGQQEQSSINQRVINLGGQVSSILNAGGGGSPWPPPPIGPFPPVVVDPNGALYGDGTAMTPLGVKVDGVTVQIISDRLTAVASSSGCCCEPITDGDFTEPELLFAIGPNGGDIVLACLP